MGKIAEAFNECKIAWLNNKNNKEHSPDFSKLAEKMSLATHVCKFSHPSARTSSIISRYTYNNDGYLHSGNVQCDLDIVRNADLSSFAKFLLIKMDDGRTVIEHLECDSREIRAELSFLKDEYDSYRLNFLKVKKDNQDPVTDERVKQVYFPVGNTYHLLSLLTSSGLLRSLRDKIEEMTERTKKCRNQKNEYYGNAYDKIYNLTGISFGGTKPQNISALNLKDMFLLPSCPPSIAERKVIRPRQDFFRNTLSMKKFRADFEYMHTLFICEKNNLAMRNKVKKTLCSIFDKVMLSAYGLRKVEAGWSEADSYCKLPMAQKIWLDEKYADLREEKDQWVDEISGSFARWILITYRNVLRTNHVTLGDSELTFLKEEVEKLLLQGEENPL